MDRKLCNSPESSNTHINCLEKVALTFNKQFIVAIISALPKAKQLRFHYITTAPNSLEMLNSFLTKFSLFGCIIWYAVACWYEVLSI